MLSVACSVLRMCECFTIQPAQLTAVLCRHLAASRCLQQGGDKGDVLARNSLSKMINVQFAVCPEVQGSVTFLYDVHTYVSLVPPASLGLAECTHISACVLVLEVEDSCCTIRDCNSTRISTINTVDVWPSGLTLLTMCCSGSYTLQLFYSVA